MRGSFNIYFYGFNVNDNSIYSILLENVRVDDISISRRQMTRPSYLFLASVFLSTSF